MRSVALELARRGMGLWTCGRGARVLSCAGGAVGSRLHASEYIIFESAPPHRTLLERPKAQAGATRGGMMPRVATLTLRCSDPPRQGPDPVHHHHLPPRAHPRRHPVLRRDAPAQGEHGQVDRHEGGASHHRGGQEPRAPARLVSSRRRATTTRLHICLARDSRVRSAEGPRLRLLAVHGRGCAQDASRGDSATFPGWSRWTRERMQRMSRPNLGCVSVRLDCRRSRRVYMESFSLSDSVCLAQGGG